MRKYCRLVDTSVIGQNVELFGWMDSLRELEALKFSILWCQAYWGYGSRNEED